MAELGSVAVIRWRGGRLRRRRGGTVRLGGERRRRLVLGRRLVLRWRLVAELLGPIKKALVEAASGGLLLQAEKEEQD
ncbi:hypothetical protein C4D60_Mb07t25770 [Musa balbisiana]|uniref:Uncharacterized protein n=1 Tax=Musa balbisiana TaxID=52838 RepID=A0A4S8JI88_MUSBA|nr:hypothetical protein C4D60_Mb07t25770 [Musa balbisiana]